MLFPRSFHVYTLLFPFISLPLLWLLFILTLTYYPLSAFVLPCLPSSIHPSPLPRSLHRCLFWVTLPRTPFFFPSSHPPHVFLLIVITSPPLPPPSLHPIFPPSKLATPSLPSGSSYLQATPFLFFPHLWPTVSPFLLSSIFFPLPSLPRL